MKSKVNYFDIKIGDEIMVVSFHPVDEFVEKKDGSDEQRLDYYKVVLDGETKVHYLYKFEVED